MDLQFIVSHYFSYEKENETQFRDYLLCFLKETFSFLSPDNTIPLHGSVSLSDVSSLFRHQNIPEHGEKMHLVLQEALHQVVQNSVRLSHPYYIGHMTQASASFNLLSDLLISVLNQNCVKIETALSATYVEWQTLTWFHKLVYRRSDVFYHRILDQAEHSIGNLCSGGTLSNLNALIVARNHVIPDIHKLGIFEAYRQANCSRAVVLVSKRGHYSIKKAAAIMGIGENNVLEIPCVPFTNQIDLEKLEKSILTLQKEKTKIICLVGIAGSTETGSVDPLTRLSDMAKKYSIWFHVDAAWGGALLMSEKYRHLLQGIEEADSVTLDGHKFFYLSLSHSLVLFKNETALNSIRHQANYILREGSVDLGRTSLEGSRRFDSFKLWFALKVLGRSGYEVLLNQAMEKGENFYQLIENHPHFEVTSFYTSGILTYRFIPEKIKKDLKNSMENQNVLEIKRINEWLNKINTELQKKQRAKGKSFVSRTRLESFFPGQEIVVLRALPFNPLTNLEILAEILEEQTEIGNSLIDCEN
jgi:putative pyridoxal-dependent aspartate 1-decarboxylase